MQHLMMFSSGRKLRSLAVSFSLACHKFEYHRKSKMNRNVNIIEEDGVSKCRRICSQQKASGMNLIHFQVLCPKEDSGKLTHVHMYSDGRVKKTECHKEFFSDVFKDFSDALWRIKFAKGEEKEKLEEFFPEFRFGRRDFSAHFDKCPRKNEEGFVIVEHLKRKKKYRRVFYNCFEDFFLEFPLITFRHEKLVLVEKALPLKNHSEVFEILEWFVN